MKPGDAWLSTRGSQVRQGTKQGSGAWRRVYSRVMTGSKEKMIVDVWTESSQCSEGSVPVWKRPVLGLGRWAPVEDIKEVWTSPAEAIKGANDVHHRRSWQVENAPIWFSTKRWCSNRRRRCFWEKIHGLVGHVLDTGVLDVPWSSRGAQVS